MSIETPPVVKKPRKDRITKAQRTEENTGRLLARFRNDADEWASLWAIFWATADCPKLALDGSAIADRIGELKTDMLA